MVTDGQLDDLLRRLEAADGLDGMQSSIEELRDLFEVDHMIYHWVVSTGDQFGIGTYSPDWVDRYVAQSYERVDPVIKGCFQRFHPVDWKRLDWSSKHARTFLTEAMSYGVGNQGFSVPIRGPAGQFALFTANHTCSDEEWAQFTEAYRTTLILVAHYLNEKALELEPSKAPNQEQNLSPREVDAMTLLAMGYSRAQVAETLSISEHTLRVYIESARFKLGALNTTHAVARAMSRGLIVV